MFPALGNVRARTVALTVALLLGGCATFSPDGGFGPVQKTVQERIGKEAAWARTDAEREA